MPRTIASQTIKVAVLFDTVTIEVRCSDDYAAQVVFDDIIDSIQQPGGITIKGAVKKSVDAG